MTIARLSNVFKTYPSRKWWQFWDIKQQEVPALDDVSFDVREGEVLAIQGANGSGKTTLLKLMAGLLYHDRGSIDVLGYSLPAGEVQVRRKVHYLAPDERSFYHRLTVKDNLKIFATLMGTDMSDDVLELLSLKPMLSRRFAGLSSGQKQRVALARALGAGGELYFLDEPTRSIDEPGIQSIRTWLDGPIRKNTTVIMAFPREDPLMDYADRVLYMENGKLT